MEEITIALGDETLDSLDRVADRDYEGDRDAAARDLIGDWLAVQPDDH